MTHYWLYFGHMSCGLTSKNDSTSRSSNVFYDRHTRLAHIFILTSIKMCDFSQPHVYEITYSILKAFTVCLPYIHIYINEFKSGLRHMMAINITQTITKCSFSTVIAWMVKSVGLVHYLSIFWIYFLNLHSFCLHSVMRFKIHIYTMNNI